MLLLRWALALTLASGASCTLVVNNELDSKPAHKPGADGDKNDELDGGSDAAPHDDASASSSDGGADGGSAEDDAGDQPGSDGGEPEDDGGAPQTNAEAMFCLGEDHGCALSSTGKLLCWGANDQGQGDLPTNRTYRALACGDSHTCALDDQGALLCRGRNADNQRVDFAAGPYAQVTAGDAHTCVLDAEGNATCWGKDANGQASPPSSKFKALSAGGSLTCGIRASDSGLVCWGFGVTAINDAAVGKKFRSIDAGPGFLCGVTQTQEGFCFGDSRYEPPALSGVKQIAGAGYSGCALLDDGSVRCWYNGLAETIAPDKAPFASVDVGYNARCLLPEQGRLHCETVGESSVVPGPEFP